MVECCNTPDVTCHICTPTLAISALSYEIPFVVGFCLRFAFRSCYEFHSMSSCASHLHSCSSHASEHFPRCPFRNPTLLRAPACPFCLFLCAGVKRSRNGPRFAKWPWYTTGRPPVKFRVIWSLFDVPMVNRGTAKASCVLQPNTPPKRPNNPSKPLP